MRPIFRLLLLVALAVTIPPAYGEESLSAKDALSAIRTYAYGQSRAPLAAVEDFTRRALQDESVRKELDRSFADFLKADATLDARQFVCKQIWMLGGDEVIPVLGRMLRKADTSDMARYALERVEGKRADRAFRKALAKTTGDTRLGIINSVGQRGDAKAIELLSKLSRATDHSTAEAAIVALGHIGGTAAADALGQCVARCKAPLLVATSCDAYLLCADRFLAEGKTEQAATIYEGMYAPDREARVRVAALRGLLAARGEKAMPLLEGVFSGNDPDSQSVAAMFIRETQGESMTKSLTGLLPGLNPNGQVLLLAALGDRGDSGALEAVASLMTSSDEQVVLAAIVAAGQLGNSGTVPGLAERAARSKGAARTAARNSLDRLRDKGTAVEEALVQVLKATAEAGIRAEAARSLAARGHRPAAAALIETARDADAELRIESLKSLSVLGQAGELSALVGLVCAPVAESDRAEAEKTLVTVARSVPAEAGKVTSLLAAFSAVAGDVPAKCSLLQSAGQIADPAALPILRASLKDNAPEVRAAAIRGLTEWNNAEPAQDLLVVARSALDESEKILAVRGFVRLVGLPCDRAGLDTLGLYAEAMKTARGVEEKKTVLGGMALVAHPGALADVMAYLKDSQLSVEAAAAAVQAANHIGLVCPDETRVAMGQVMAAFPGTPIAVGAERAVARLDATKDYVMAWQVAGPYMDEDKRFRELLDTVFAPEDSNATGIVWKIMPGTPQSDKPWLLDFRPLMDGIKRVAYLRTKVFSPVAQEAEIVCGSDDAMRVWLNATVVHTLNKGRACNPESDKVKVSLVEGWNTLLVKVANDDDQWETCLRIRSTSGAPIEGLKVSLE